MVRSLVESSEAVTTSVLAYPEARATLARQRREGRLSAAQFAACRRSLDGDWPAFVTIQVTHAICRAAGDLADRYGLRGFDSVHLACYLDVVAASAPTSVTFSSFDERLTRAALTARRAIDHSNTAPLPAPAGAQRTFRRPPDPLMIGPCSGRSI